MLTNTMFEMRPVLEYNSLIGFNFFRRAEGKHPCIRKE